MKTESPGTRVHVYVYIVQVQGFPPRACLAIAYNEPLRQRLGFSFVLLMLELKS